MRPELRTGILSAMLLVFGGFLDAQSDTSELDRLLEEAAEVDARFHVLSRSIPVFDSDRAERYVERLSEFLGIPGIETALVPGSEMLADARGEPTPVELHRVEVTGSADFSEIHALLRAFRRGTVLTHLESLRITAVPPGGGTFTARLVVPSMTAQAPQDEFAEEDVVQALRRKLERDRANLDALLQYVEKVKMDRRLDALALLTNDLSLGVALTEAVLGERIHLTGIAVGARALASLDSSLDSAGLTGRSIDISPALGCNRFTVAAEIRPGDDESAIATGPDPFDAEAFERCAGQPEPPRKSIVIGDRQGIPVLTLRKVDLVDLFFVLHDLFALNAVIDEPVVGIVDLEVFGDAGMDELLSALGDTAVVGPGPLRRVSASAVAESSRTANEGEPVTFSMRRVSVRDLLCLAESLDGAELWMPRGSMARVSIFAEAQPLAAVVEALTESAGFPTQEMLARAGGERVCDASTSDASAPRIDPRAMTFVDFGPGDLQLAGLAILGTVNHAYVYTPGRVLRRVEAGQELFVGRVTAVTSSGVTIETPSGEVRLTLTTENFSPPV